MQGALWLYGMSTEDKKDQETPHSQKKDQETPHSQRSPQGSKDTTDVKSGTRSAKSGSRSQTSKSATRTQTTQDGGDEEKSVKVLVAKIRKCDNSAERAELSKELGRQLATGVSTLFIFGLFIFIAIVEIVVGSLNVHNCSVNNMVPIWLIVSGGVSCLRYTLLICFGIVDRNKGNLLKIRAFLEPFFCIFWIIWLILGTFWTYSVSKIVTYDKQDGSTYCDHLTYVLAFVIITAIWVIIVMFLVSCCCCCCICCVAALCAKAPPSTSKEKEERVDE